MMTANVMDRRNKTKAVAKIDSMGTPNMTVMNDMLRQAFDPRQAEALLCLLD